MATKTVPDIQDDDEEFPRDEPGVVFGGVTHYRAGALFSDVTGGHGGARKGAGRKPAARAKVRSHSKEAAARIVELGPIKGTWPPKAGESPELPEAATPLDVLLEAMHEAYRTGGPIAAAPFAEKAAPYVHGKISNIELRNPSGMYAGDKPMPFRIEFVQPRSDLDDDGLL